ncbi:MAG: YcaO-like family protein [Epsilonproteobacteria bacterium]|nr:YcaO-like family protein [Campylobacterota bacterium]
MNFQSKASSLQESISTMQKVLQNAGCSYTFSQEKHPLGNCFSINIASKEAPQHIYANGKGVLSDASMASALGEYIERLQTNNFFVDFHLPERTYYPDQEAFEFGGGYLNKKLLKLYDPHRELSDEDLVDFNSDYTDKIVSLPFINQTTKERVYFPLNILANLYVSNGLASGNTPLEAQVQALSEIIERHVKIEIIKNAYALPSYDDAELAKFPRVAEDVAALRKLGYVVEVHDASLGGRFPVTAISLINPKNATLFVSFGSHPILEVSLERTMTELMQGRDIENLDNFETPTFDMSIVAESLNLESHFIDSNGRLGFGFLNANKSFSHAAWSFEKQSIDEQHALLCDIIKKEGKEIYLREYDFLGFYSCHIIVPTFSEVYPMEDMLYNNKNGGKRIRDMILNRDEYDAEDLLTEIEALDETLDAEKYIGVIFKENFTIGELKAQLLLELGETEEAILLFESSQKRLAKLLAELLHMESQGLDFDDYAHAFSSLFGAELTQKALRIIDGEASFIDTTLSETYKGILKMYDSLEIQKRAMIA